mmetsp:Transcript_9200/g.12173  ORF Transcript_9200/g.12173 Transcript_9200/m.12173 type:complete len:179 (+) Transcript_9200:64-600(+)
MEDLLKEYLMPIQNYVPVVERMNLLAIAVTSGILMLLNLIHFQFKRFENRLSPQEINLKKEIKALKLEKSKLSAVSDFVEVSMIERKMIKKEKQLDSWRAKRTAKRSGWLSAIVKTKKMLMIGLIIVFWATPIIQFSEFSFWPMARVVGFPGHESGCIGILAWIYIVQKVVAGTVLKL